MPRVIERLLLKAARHADRDGIVPADIEMQLAAEGYDLDALDTDIARIIRKKEKHG